MPASASPGGIAAIAHDLRSPLAAIEFGATRLLIETTPDQETVKRTIRSILRALSHAKRLTNELAEAAENSGRAVDVQPQLVEASQLLANAALLAEPVAHRASLTIVVDDGADLPRVWADIGQIDRVFENLVGNAAKFTPPDGRIEVRATAVEDEVRFSVSDTGRGVNPEDRVRMFAPFWKADPGDGRGQGLGLCICRQIVEQHGGRIWYEDRPDAGAAFVFALLR